ncbi:MAG TPA: hypothetical protein VLF89_05425 [Candidatus Saccharimonadales bacterium]|nr:hypothetical protein [Candidatus Saccharimonadales bacterium]
MGKTLLEKMFAKPTYKMAIIHTPEELKSELWTDSKIDDKLTDAYNFILLFNIKQHELEQELPQLKKSLAENGLLWIAYPKGKMLQTDLNRDILRELLQQYNLESVSLVSLNDTWSAMRFKKA